MNTAMPTPPPVELLRQLTSAAINSRLTEIEAERKSLLTLLRSVAAREREARRQKGREAAAPDRAKAKGAKS